MERNDITDFGNQNKNNIDKNIINNNNSEKRPSHNNHDINDKSDDISFSKEDIKNKIDNNNENTSGRDINNLTTKPNECNNIYCLNCICCCKKSKPCCFCKCDKCCNSCDKFNCYSCQYHCCERFCESCCNLFINACCQIF